eukprot:2740077-Rhodomonas_salina.2
MMTECVLKAGHVLTVQCLLQVCINLLHVMDLTERLGISLHVSEVQLILEPFAALKVLPCHEVVLDTAPRCKLCGMSFAVRVMKDIGGMSKLAMPGESRQKD